VHHRQYLCSREALTQLTPVSWELGTLAEALTEYEYPGLSVFADTLATNLPGVYPQAVMDVAVPYARTHVLPSQFLNAH